MRFFQFCACLVFLNLLPAAPANGASTDEAGELTSKLKVRVADYSLGAGDFVHALAGVASRFHLPMGIEWALVKDTEKPIHRTWHNTTVQEILTAVVREYPDYELDLRDGIVRVFPKGKSSPESDFLNLSLERFEVRNQVVELASKQLRELVRSRMGNGLRGRSGGGMALSQSTTIGDPEFSLALVNPSVDQVLDKLALASDRKIWVVTYLDNARLPGSAYRRTITLWNTSKVPDSEQPVWDMFRWSDAIP